MNNFNMGIGVTGAYGQYIPLIESEDDFDLRDGPPPSKVIIRRPLDKPAEVWDNVYMKG